LTLGGAVVGRSITFDAISTTVRQRGHDPHAIECTKRKYGNSPEHTDFRTRGRSSSRTAAVVSMICKPSATTSTASSSGTSTTTRIEVRSSLRGGSPPGPCRMREAAMGKSWRAQHLWPHHQHCFNLPARHEASTARATALYEWTRSRTRSELNPPQRLDHQGTLGRIPSRSALGTGTGSTGRHCKIAKPSKTNELGAPVAYKLTPREDCP